jgi:DNA-directed RNA polymerase specialized sigma24 family protein
MTRYQLRDLIAPLRRYGRLMTGDTAIADKVLLRMLAEARPRPGGGSVFRLKLYRALTGALAIEAQIVSPALASIARGAPCSDGALAAAACALPFVERAVLGLVAVEGFKPAEAALILKMPAMLVERSLNSALDRLSPMPVFKAPAPVYLAEAGHA